MKRKYWIIALIVLAVLGVSAILLCVFLRTKDNSQDTSSELIQLENAPLSSLSLNGLPIAQYAIVNPVEEDSPYYQDSAFLAQVLRQRIGELCGWLLPIQDAKKEETTASGLIRISIEPTFDSLLNDLVSPSAETASWHLTAENNVIRITGTAANCTARALDAFISKLTPPSHTETFAAQIDPADPVSMDTDITLMRIDMMGQWPSHILLEEDVMRECPDIFVLENAEDSVGFTVIDEFDGYYTRQNMGISCDIWFCSDRFSVIDEGEIRLPENADLDATLHSHYVVLRDQMTYEELVVFTSDVSETTIEEFEKTVQYLCFPEKDVIYLGSSLPYEAAALFSDIPALEGETVIRTLVTDGLKITAYEDRTDELISHHKDSAPIWHDRGEAHTIRIEYAED